MKSCVVREFGPLRSERDEAALVALRDRVVFQVRVAPDGVELRIAVDAELHHELRNDPEETPAVEVAVLHQVVETIRAIRRPGARDFDDERTNRRVEVGAEGGWRRLLQLGRRSERGIDRGRLGSRGLRGSRFLRRGRRRRGFGLTRRRCRGLGRRLRKSETRKERHCCSARDCYCPVRTSCHLWSLF